MNIDELTLGEIKEIMATINQPAETASEHPYDINVGCLIRTVAHIYTGILVAVYPQEIVLKDAAWIADTGRFADSLLDFSKFNEVEPFPAGLCVVGRGAICDYHASTQAMPRVQK